MDFVFCVVQYSVVYTHSLAFPLGSVYSLGVMSNIQLVSIFSGNASPLVASTEKGGTKIDLGGNLDK